MFSALVFGSLFLVSGLIGIRADRNFLTGRLRWEDSPILSQVALGAGLIMLGLFWYHRLADPRLNVFRRHPPKIRHVGAGKSAGAMRTDRNRLDGSTE
jgi:hypothetical protein